MVYSRPSSYINDVQLKTIYDAMHRTYVTASASILTLRHVVSALPLEVSPGPYDVGAMPAMTVDIELHAMVGAGKDGRNFTSFGEMIDADLRLYIWLQEMEGAGLGTAPSELDILTKDEIIYDGEHYEIIECSQAMNFFGDSWSAGTVPDPYYNRAFLAARFLADRKSRV